MKLAFLHFTEWFGQQLKRKTAIQDMTMEELNSFLKDFYVSCKKKDSGYNKKMSIMGIRAAIDRFLRVEHNKPFSIVGNPAFSEANLVLDSLVKDLRKTGKIGRIVHKKSITKDQLQHLFETGELGQADSMDPSQLQKNCLVLCFMFL